jgi:hypothetical protein
MMSGGGQSAGGSGANGTVFIPPNQGAAADSLQQIIQPLLGLSANAGAGTPAGINYPLAQNAVYNDLVNSPFANDALNASRTTAGDALNFVAPDAAGNSDLLRSTVFGGMPFANTALQQGFDPRYNAAISGIENNPYYGQALGGAQQAAQMGAQGASAIQGLGGQIGGQVPQLQGLARQIGGAVNPLLESGFDPRSALFNRTEGRLMDQTNAINAMSGLGGTPYGASVGAATMGNFDIDWQNQQLARQAQAAGAAGQAAGQAGNLYGQAGQSANTAANLYGAAPGLLASTAGLPSNVYTGQIGQVLQALKAREQGANQGIAGYGTMLGAGGTGLGQANAQTLSALNTENTYGAAPYNTQSTIGQNSLAGLTNLTQLGNNQFALPQQEIGNLMQYMGLGQSASGLSGQLGNLGFQQTAQGLGGALSGANTLFGQGGIGSGLFGGGGGAGAATGGAFGLGDFGGGGAALGVPDALGLGAAPLAADAGGGGLLSALPLALSA